MRGRPIPEVVALSVRRFMIEPAETTGRFYSKRAYMMLEPMLRDVPEARQAALDAGMLNVVEHSVAVALEPQADRACLESAAWWLSVLSALRVDEANLRRIVGPLLKLGVPTEVRSAAIRALGRNEFRWAVDLVINALTDSLDADERDFSSVSRAAALAFARIGDPKSIPVMVAAIDAGNTDDSNYWVGHFGLRPLTLVAYDKTHDGAWWRSWWEKNREKYPADVRDLPIPALPARDQVAQADVAAGGDDQAAGDDDGLAGVKDVPAQDLTIGGNEKKRYFLIGAAAGAAAPDEPHGLLVVLPGGDGSAAFNPFLRRMHKHVLGPRWLLAQAVAPQWDDKQASKVVWPTAGLPYAGAKFTTEEFIEAIIADVRAKSKIDPKRIFLLGWSSGGPPCYATLLRKESSVTGAF
ncbi:MAG TPA: HEAT repeat domain-containing protein, partial [Planctomycetaceae bacterium]